jgi:hypothetical protein
MSRTSRIRLLFLVIVVVVISFLLTAASQAAAMSGYWTRAVAGGCRDKGKIVSIVTATAFALGVEAAMGIAASVWGHWQSGEKPDARRR